MMMLDKIKQKAINDNIPIIMDETLEVIEKYLLRDRPKRILEIGTAVGYSAICFSEFLQEGGIIDTITGIIMIVSSIGYFIAFSLYKK